MKRLFSIMILVLSTVVLLGSCGGGGGGGSGGGSNGPALSISNLSPTSVTLSTTPAGIIYVNLTFNESGGTGNITGHLNLFDNNGNLFKSLTTPNTAPPTSIKTIIVHVDTSILVVGTSGTFDVYEVDSAGSVSNKLTGTWNVVSSSGPTLTSISVTPTNPSINVGVTQQFTATGYYSDGTNKNLTTAVTWSSSNTGFATISSTGLATAKAAGTTNITATSGGISGFTVLTVTTAPPPPPQYGSILWKNTTTTGYLDYLSISSNGGASWYANQLPSAYSPLGPGTNFTLTNVPPGTYIAAAQDTELWTHTVYYGLYSTTYSIYTTYCSETPSFTVAAGATSTVTFGQLGFTGSLVITNTDANGNYMYAVYVDGVMINPFNIYPGGYVQPPACTLAPGLHTLDVYWSNGVHQTIYQTIYSLTTTVL